MRIVATAFAGFIGTAALAEDQGYNPNNGFVPDAKTAVAIARAILVPIYGRQTIASEEPLVAARRGDLWIVRGSLHCGAPACVGGTAEVKLSAKDGRILHVTHYQ
jgi:hypothetical protein